jgi:hypothetical protein
MSAMLIKPTRLLRFVLRTPFALITNGHTFFTDLSNLFFYFISWKEVVLPPLVYLREVDLHI